MSSSLEKPDTRPTMENTFEITAELRAQFDVESEPWPYEVTTTGVRAFARGVGYTDEIYYDLNVARTNGHNGLPAPPCYLGTPVYHPARSDEVFSVPQGTGPRPRYGLTNVLDGGTEIHYERPLESGETNGQRSTDRPAIQAEQILRTGGDRHYRSDVPRRRGLRRRPRALAVHPLLGADPVQESTWPSVGDELPPLTKKFERSQLVVFAAGSGDFNPLHFDPNWPQARVIGDNIVQDD